MKNLLIYFRRIIIYFLPQLENKVFNFVSY